MPRPPTLEVEHSCHGRRISKVWQTCLVAALDLDGPIVRSRRFYQMLSFDKYHFPPVKVYVADFLCPFSLVDQDRKSFSRVLISASALNIREPSKEAKGTVHFFTAKVSEAWATIVSASARVSGVNIRLNAVYWLARRISKSAVLNKSAEIAWIEIPNEKGGELSKQLVEQKCYQRWNESRKEPLLCSKQHNVNDNRIFQEFSRPLSAM